MKLGNPFRLLTKFEIGLWTVSVTALLCSFFASGAADVLSLIASILGVTSLIFLARGFVIGQALMILFAILYAIISFKARYYGEMITYLGMSAPAALIAMINWLRHPYKESSEVEVSHHLSVAAKLLLGLGTVGATVGFYFILRALGTANLLVSTASVATSFLAATLAACRNPYYALVYALNDLVLIALWIAVMRGDLAALNMTICFVVFLVNDLYGFFSWLRMAKRQRE